MSGPQLEDSDVIQQCKKVIGMFNGKQVNFWFVRTPEFLIDAKDNHIPIPIGHLGVICDLALAIVIGAELDHNSGRGDIKNAINGYGAVLAARTKDSEYEDPEGTGLHKIHEFSDGTALSTLVNTQYATGIEQSSVWYSVNDKVQKKINIADLPHDPVSLVFEALKWGKLQPGDLVLFMVDGDNYCKAGDTIELGLEGFLRSQFTVEKMSEVQAAINQDLHRHEKMVRHVVDELLDH
ncbi:unnamed protein product [Bursaphelenchus okinawaensis]|uniref:Fumarylacetoacetase-like C-terminal domain-containing protein n=1 Tax=Bursaphelenchus okinawaensis TaxID=465554 RepID=A0A811L9I4_9BILA|nr:unnamed protein product [Bursaphelenchus okinawaensis]CAG9118783.1 unnamed protein product [Bursaphelenchus okinawaensis]